MTAPASVRPRGMTVRPSSIVVAPRRPELGTGVVVSATATSARVFFLGGGRRTIDLDGEALTPGVAADGEAAVIAAVARTRPPDWEGKRCHHNVYAVLLSSAVRKSRPFALRNPAMRAGERCVYVGVTGLTPEERYANHKADHKGGRYVARHGRGLLPDLYARFNPMPWPVAEAFEPFLADALRRQGYGVWQN